jgi:hypothetical protein
MLRSSGLEVRPRDQKNYEKQDSTIDNPRTIGIF